MLNSQSYGKLRNGERYNIIPESEMSENGNVEENRTSTSSENVDEDLADTNTLTQKWSTSKSKGSSPR